MNPMTIIAMAAFLPAFPQSTAARRKRGNGGWMVTCFALWASGFALGLSAVLP